MNDSPVEAPVGENMSVPPTEHPTEPSPEQKKEFMAAAWSASAIAYAASFEEITDKNAPHLDMPLARKLVVSKIVGAMAEKESPVVLDVAAAGGEPALSMAKEMPHATVHGTDFAPGMVELIRERSEKAEVTNLTASVEDGELLSGFEDGSVDAVTCTWGLESMPNGQAAIGHFHRVLKPGGLAVVAVWEKDPNSIAAKMFRVIAMLNKADQSPVDIQPLGAEDGVKAMEEAGFVDVEASPVSLPFYIPSGFKFRDLFSYMVTPTPLNAALAAMEAHGCHNIRDEACALFESLVLEDIAKGKGPSDSGLLTSGGASDVDGTSDVAAGSTPPDAYPTFFMHAAILQGRKSG